MAPLFSLHCREGCVGVYLPSFLRILELFLTSALLVIELSVLLLPHEFRLKKAPLMHILRDA